MDNDLDFYNANRLKSFYLETLPSGTVEQQATWIMQQKHIGWLELDTLHPVEYTELDAYVDHRGHETHQGWSSFCIHGLGTDKTATAPSYGYDEFNAPYDFTDASTHFPRTVSYWKSFPAERFTRIRFMKLSAGGSISVHNDGYENLPQDFDPLDGILPINVAVIHPNDCEMVIEDCGSIPFSAGKVFLINVAKQHMVVNNSQKDRIHLIANLILGNKKKEFCELLVRSYEKCYRVQSKV
jgi:hypothetical protein